MKPLPPCPICSGVHDGKTDEPRSINGWLAFICDVCGPVGLTDEAAEGLQALRVGSLPKVRLAALSHLLSTADREEGNKYYFLSAKQIDGSKTLHLPTPSIQKLNFIRLIGDRVTVTGANYVQDYSTAAKVGVISGEKLQSLHGQLQKAGLIVASSDNRPRPNSRGGSEVYFPDFDLTLDGWDFYEKEKSGRAVGHYGFIALKFGEAELNAFLKAVKPGIEKATGYPLNDVLHFQRAGIIDNIIRDQIRNAAFIVADLTHGNQGAYWEAGYAEGLGKPVIYICEKKVFDTADTRPHFDTNHCTTVMWQSGEEAAFVEAMTATIRNSIAYHS